MNHNHIYPWAYDGIVSFTFYLDRTHMFPTLSFGFIIKNRMTGEEIKFVPYIQRWNNRKIKMAFEITNDPLFADPQVGTIYINQDGYWDYQLYYSIVPFWDVESPNDIYPVEQGSMFFYRDENNTIFTNPSQHPEIIYISPEDKGYNMNENFTASVLNTNPTI